MQLEKNSLIIISIMNYPNNKEIKVNDLIWHNEGEFVGRVLKIISSEEDPRDWGEHKPGILLSSDILSNQEGTLIYEETEYFEELDIKKLTHVEITLINCLVKLLSIQLNINIEKEEYSCAFSRMIPRIIPEDVEPNYFLTIGRYTGDGHFTGVEYKSLGIYMLDNKSLEFIDITYENYLKIFQMGWLPPS